MSHKAHIHFEGFLANGCMALHDKDALSGKFGYWAEDERCSSAVAALGCYHASNTKKSRKNLEHV